jgi:hypothetical protein
MVESGPLASVIDTLPQFLPGSKVRHVLRRNRDLLPGSWIPASSGQSTDQGETPKPPDLDAITARQDIGDRFKNQVHRDLSILNGETRRVSCKTNDEIGTVHGVNISHSACAAAIVGRNKFARAWRRIPDLIEGRSDQARLLRRGARASAFHEAIRCTIGLQRRQSRQDCHTARFPHTEITYSLAT